MPALPKGPALFAPERANSKGFDLTHQPTLDEFEHQRSAMSEKTWAAAPLINGTPTSTTKRDIINPARHDDIVGTVITAGEGDIETALSSAKPWDASVTSRATILNAAADTYEANAAEIFTILTREAGKALRSSAVKSQRRWPPATQCLQNRQNKHR